MKTMTEALTETEIEILRDWSLWGSKGYRVHKDGRKWYVQGIKRPFATKREAVAAWEGYIEMLRDKKAGRI